MHAAISPADLRKVTQLANGRARTAKGIRICMDGAAQCLRHKGGSLRVVAHRAAVAVSTTFVRVRARLGRPVLSTEQTRVNSQLVALSFGLWSVRK